MLGSQPIPCLPRCSPAVSSEHQGIELKESLSQPYKSASLLKSIQGTDLGYRPTYRSCLHTHPVLGHSVLLWAIVHWPILRTLTVSPIFMPGAQKFMSLTGTESASVSLNLGYVVLRGQQTI